MRSRYLTVPKNKKGIEEYYSGAEHTDNMIEVVLEESEFDVLYKNNVFKRINIRCGLMIDDYESEIITIEEIEKCKNIIDEEKGTFLKMANEAIKCKTFLALDF